MIRAITAQLAELAALVGGSDDVRITDRGEDEFVIRIRRPDGKTRSFRVSLMQVIR